jgi:hypothetical protein
VLDSLAVLVLWAALGAADPTASIVRAQAQLPPRTYVELRMGPTSASRNARYDVCLAAQPLRRLGVEACGTGAGFLHHDPEPEMSHFRAELGVWSFEALRGYFDVLAAAGVAELQVAAGTPGFTFEGTNAAATETAGAEVGLALRFRFALTERFELVGKSSAALAYLPHAAELQRPMSRLQPTLSATLGIGF